MGAHQTLFRGAGPTPFSTPAPKSSRTCATFTGRQRGAGSMRVSAGSHGVGKALDGELAQLGPLAGLTSAQTDAVIPVGTTPSLAARVR